MPRFVLDTNIYVAAVRDATWAEEVERFSAGQLPFIHVHAVVAQELLAGAKDRNKERAIEENLVTPFEKRGRVITPSFAAWKEAGRIVSRLVRRRLVSPGGFTRSFLNDCVLAASCREAGVTLITLNREDFDLIRREMKFDFSEPWPN
jgi:predicted nucleic acid-binding protein